MARDETARDTDANDELLDRRSYLKLAGAAAASVAATSAVADGAAAASYDTIEVSAGETRVIRVGPGETFENKLIDITAGGAHVKLLTSGSGWTVRNVGVKGENDDRSGTKASFYFRCTDGGEGLAENVYLGDGAADRCGHAAVSGYGNSGHVTIRNVHVQGWSADGMYLSQPGVPGNSGGTFTVERAFAKNNNIENIRIGTKGSKIVDSVVHVEGRDAVTSNESGQKNPRGIWFKEETGLLAENCDVKVAGASAVYGGGRGGAGTLRNCRVEGTIAGDVTEENVTGDPDVTPPEGVPMSAEEAASGTASAEKPSVEQPTTEPAPAEPEGTVLELVSSPDASSERYEFTVDGGVKRRTDAGDVSAESGDKLVENGDGTVTVSGVAGNGYGDSFLVEGAVTAMELDESQWTLSYGGEEVAVADLVLPNTLVIDGSETPRRATTYEFSVSGRAEKNGAIASINAYDEVDAGTITGRVVGGKDAYRYSGDVTGFTLDGPADVTVRDDS